MMKKLIINIIKDSWIDWIQLFLIVLIAPFFLFPSMQYVWIFLVVPVIWLCRWIVKKHFLDKTVLDWVLVILLIQVFATCIIVKDLGSSIPKISGILFGMAFFYSTVALLDSEKLIKWGIVGFLGAGLVLSVVGTLGMQWDKEIYFIKIITKIEKIIPKINWNLPGAEEGFNSNAIGGTLILIIPLCLLLSFLYFNRKKENYFITYKLFPLIFFCAISLVICSVLFFTLSLGSWIALTSSIWILLLSWKWKKWSSLLILLFITFIYLLSTYKTDEYMEGRNNNVMTMNEPYTLVGPDLVQNGKFEGRTDGWNPRASALLASVSGGQLGNCLSITEGGADNPNIRQYIPVTRGKIYKFTYYAKQGTESNYYVRLRDITNHSEILNLTNKYTGANWEQLTYTFEVPNGCAMVQIFFQINAAFGSGQSLYLDEVSLYEITPICKSVEDKAFDTWVKNTRLNFYRKHSFPNIKGIFSTFKNEIVKRESLWLVGINKISQRPFFGIGMNRIRQIPSVDYKKSHVHNHLLHTAAELGIPGLIAYLAILIGAGFMCFEIWRRSNTVWMKMTALGLGCGQLAHFIFGMADSIPLGAKVSIFFWFSLALIAAIYNYMLKKDIDSG